MSTPDINLVVIAFNEEAHIGSCIRSIVAQADLDSYELIVVDDGSSDRTSEIVRGFQREYPMIKLIQHSENRGRGAARRTGQDACTADVIGFIDSDITLPADWLARTTSALETADVVSGVAVPDGDFAVIWRMFRPVSRAMPGDWALTGNNVLFKRAALERIGWPAESRLTEDCRMARAMVEAGMSVKTLRDLHVEHHEAKTYRQALGFMREMGFYSTEILRDLRLIRLPDLAWLCWVATILAAVALALTGVVGPLVAVAIAVAMTLAINFAAMAQRFAFWGAPLRWIAAACANVPLMSTYLAFRTFNSPRLLLKRRPTL